MTIFYYVYGWREYFEKNNFMIMNDNISDVMVDKFKILILYVLRDIDVADIRKIILEREYGKNYTDRINYIPHIPNYSYKYLLC